MYFSSGSHYRAKKITVVHHYELLFFYRENRTPHRKATVSLFDLLFSISSSIRPVSATLTEEESLRHQPNETKILWQKCRFTFITHLRKSKLVSKDRPVCAATKLNRHVVPGSSRYCFLLQNYKKKYKKNKF